MSTSSHQTSKLTFFYNGTEYPVPQPRYPEPCLTNLGTAKDRSQDTPTLVQRQVDTEFESAISPRVLHGNSNSFKKRWHALALGSIGVTRQPNLLDTRSQDARKVFMKEPYKTILNHLDTLCQGIPIKFQDPEEILYVIDLTVYNTIMETVGQRYAKIGAASSNSAYTSVGACPGWGDPDHPYDAQYTKNDFEILSVLFRCEIESHLLVTSQFEHLLTKTPPVTPLRAALASQIRQSKSPLSPLAKTSNRLFEDQSDQVSSIKSIAPLSTHSVPPESVALPPSVTIEEETPEIGLAVDSGATPLMDFQQTQAQAEHTSYEHDYVPDFVNEDHMQKIYTDGMDTSSTFGQHQSQGAQPPSSSSTNSVEAVHEAINNDPPECEASYMHTAAGQPPDDGGSESSDDDRSSRRRNPRRPLANGPLHISTPVTRNHGHETEEPTSDLRSKEPHFDLKLKTEHIPEWDGDSDHLLDWILKINMLSQRSKSVFDDLGKIVPLRLTGTAEKVWSSLSVETREAASANWGTLRHLLSRYYMTEHWIWRQRRKARDTYYRDSSNPYELPSDYYIRKKQILQVLFRMSTAETIMEIMNGTPLEWRPILSPHLCKDLEQLQFAIKFHEETLLKFDEVHQGSSHQSSEEESEHHEPHKIKPQFKACNGDKESTRNPHVYNLVGSSDKIQEPKHSKDDSMVSKHSSPKDREALPCRRCGRDHYWDSECHYSTRNRVARIRFVDSGRDAQDEYDQLYQSLSTNSKEGKSEGAVSESTSSCTKDDDGQGGSLDLSNSSAIVKEKIRRQAQQ